MVTSSGYPTDGPGSFGARRTRNPTLSKCWPHKWGLRKRRLEISILKGSMAGETGNPFPATKPVMYLPLDFNHTRNQGE